MYQDMKHNQNDTEDYWVIKMLVATKFLHYKV